MRFVVCGAGAIGGVVGASLSLAGHDVTLMARGVHRQAISDRGLRLETPAGSRVVRLPVVDDPCQLDWQDSAVVLMAVKSQHTAGILERLASGAPRTISVVCLQNGVENERQALRRFREVYGVCVMCPATHLEPGVVQAHSAPLTGMLDIGRFPSGVDRRAQMVAEAFESAGFESVPRADIMRWKYTKLLSNLTNGLEAMCGPSARAGELADLIRSEAVAVLDRAGIEYASDREDAARREGKLHLAPTASGRWQGGSSWQSVARRAGSIETDYLNGEISLLGRIHRVATPANDAVGDLARSLVGGDLPAGSCSTHEVTARVREAIGRAGPPIPG